MRGSPLAVLSLNENLFFANAHSTSFDLVPGGTATRISKSSKVCVHTYFSASPPLPLFGIIVPGASACGSSSSSLVRRRRRRRRPSPSSVTSVNFPLLFSICISSVRARSASTRCLSASSIARAFAASLSAFKRAASSSLAVAVVAVVDAFAAARPRVVFPIASRTAAPRARRVDEEIRLLVQKRRRTRPSSVAIGVSPGRGVRRANLRRVDEQRVRLPSVRHRSRRARPRRVASIATRLARASASLAVDDATRRAPKCRVVDSNRVARAIPSRPSSRAPRERARASRVSSSTSTRVPRRRRARARATRAAKDSNPRQLRR